MPACRSCGAPIFFLTEQPRPTTVGGFTGNAREVWSEPKPLPIDVDPDPKGNIAIYEVPPPNSIVRKFTGTRGRFIARLAGFALSSFKELGGTVYTVHFDTCRTRGRRL